jgi:hypothetical protein
VADNVVIPYIMNFKGLANAEKLREALTRTVARSQQKFVDNSIKEQLRNENALYKSNQIDINRAFKESVDRRRKILSVLKDDIISRSREEIRNTEATLSRQVSLEKQYADARSKNAQNALNRDFALEEAKRAKAAQLLREDILSRSKLENSRVNTVGKSVSDANSRELLQDRERSSARNKAIADSLTQKVLEQEKASQAALATEQKIGRQYQARLDTITKLQSKTKDYLATLQKVNGATSPDVQKLQQFAAADPRTLVRGPGGGPPNKPPSGGGGSDFFNSDDDARKSVARLVTVTKAQEKFRTAVQRFGESAGLAAKRYGAFLIGTFAITRIASAFTQGTQEALVFEKAIGRLSQTIRQLGDTTEQARGRGVALGDAILTSARRTGVASNDIAAGVVEIAQAGNDQAGALKFVADQLANTQLSASFDDIKSTAEGLIAVQGQFNLQLSGTQDLLDKINQVSTAYAIESGNFFEAVKRGGSTFAGLGGTFEEFIEYLTLIRSATRETAPTLGVFFKTGLGRLSKAPQQQILREFGVGQTDENFTVIDQIRKLAESEKFQRLSDTERIRTTIALFGAQQAGRGEKLLSELGKQSKIGPGGRVTDVIGDSSGSVARDIKIVEEDVGRSIGRITQSFQSFFNVLLQDQSVRKFFKGLADGLSSLSEFVNENRGVLNFFVRLAAVVASLAVAFKGLEFLRSARGGFLGNAVAGAGEIFASSSAAGLPGSSQRGGFRNYLRNNFGGAGNRGALATAGVGAGIGAIGLASFLTDRSISQDQRFDGSRNNDRITSSGLSGATTGGIIGATLGSVVPVFGTAIGAAVGVAVGGLVGAIRENSKIIRENSNSLIAQGFKAASGTSTDSDQRLADKFAQALSAQLKDRSTLSVLASGFGGRTVSETNRDSRTFTISKLSEESANITNLLNSRVNKLSFSSQTLGSQVNFDVSVKTQLSEYLSSVFNPGGDIEIGKKISDIITDFVGGTFDSSKFRQSQLNDQLRKQISGQVLDTEAFDRLSTNIQAINVALGNAGNELTKSFNRILDSFDGFTTDFDGVTSLRTARNQSDLFARNGVSFGGLEDVASVLTKDITSLLSNPGFLRTLSDTTRDTKNLPSLENIDALQSVETALTTLLTKGGLSAAGGVDQQALTRVFSFLGSFNDSLSDSFVSLNNLAQGADGAVKKFVDDNLLGDISSKLEGYLRQEAEVFNRRIEEENRLNGAIRDIAARRAAGELEIGRSRLENGLAQRELLTNGGQNSIGGNGQFLNNAAGAIRPADSLLESLRQRISSVFSEQSLLLNLNSQDSRQSQDPIIVDELNRVTSLRLDLESQLGIQTNKLIESIGLSARAADEFANKADKARKTLQSIGEQSINGSLDRNSLNSGAGVLRSLLTNSDDNRLRDRTNSQIRGTNTVNGRPRNEGILSASSDFNVGNFTESFERLTQQSQKQVTDLLKTLGDTPIVNSRDRRGGPNQVFTATQLSDLAAGGVGARESARFLSRATGRPFNEILAELTQNIVKAQKQSDDARRDEIAGRQQLIKNQEAQNELLKGQLDNLLANTTALGSVVTALDNNSAALSKFIADLPKIFEQQAQNAANGASDLSQSMSVTLSPVDVNVNVRGLEIIETLIPKITDKVMMSLSKNLVDIYGDEPDKAAKARALAPVDPNGF